MKRGLKRCSAARSASDFAVEESAPMKRGLKRCSAARSASDFAVEESAPMKRGLKLQFKRMRASCSAR